MDYNIFLSSLDEDFINEDYLPKENHYNYNGVTIPRVSDILKLLSNSDSLMMWSNSLGFKRMKYKETLQLAADRGTAIHNAVEDYVLNKKIPDYSMYNDFIAVSLHNAFEGFKLWWDGFTKDHKVKVLDVEKTLLCPYFGGTLDMLLEVNGKTYIYDFKTSNNIQYKHYIQLSAYKYCIENYYGINVDGGVSILKLNKNKYECKEFLLSFSIEENVLFVRYCTELFMSLLYSYYQNSRTIHFYNQTVMKMK